MFSPSLTEEQKRRIKELVALGNMTRLQIAAAAGVGETSVGRIKREMREGSSPAKSSKGDLGQTEEVSPERTDEVRGDNWNISINKTNISTLDELIEECKIDLSIWEVERCQFKHWGMGFVRKAVTTKGKLQDVKVMQSGVQPLYSVSAVLKKKRNIVDARAEIEALKAEAKMHMFVPVPVVYTTQDSDNMLELLIPDLHAAKLAWSKETGFQNYDTNIAIETYDRAVDKLIQKASKHNISKFIIGVGNDVLQADNIQGTTFGGTKVDTDSRYRKSYKQVRQMFCRNIEKLRQIAPVDVEAVPGNHDTLSTFTLADSLECAFAHYPEVFVNNQPIPHKIVTWGKVLLALMHGDKGKQADYGIWLATTYPEEFAHALFREIHVGHKHTVSLMEKFGIRVRGFGALCPPDEWHANNLFTGNLRVAEGLVWNKHEGLTDILFHTEIDSMKRSEKAA